MDYVSIEEAKAASGLRVALGAGGPGCWSEAVRGLLKVRNVDYIPVAQLGGQPNEELVAWTGHRNAPLAMYNDEPAKTTAPEIIALAERLGSGPSLVPEDVNDRVKMYGLINELTGENGFGWSVRVLMIAGMIAAMGEEAVSQNPMFKEYHFTPDQVPGALKKVNDVVQALSSQLGDSRYFFGDSMSALDIYWPAFSQMLSPLAQENCPMPDTMRGGFMAVAKAFADAGNEVPANLIEHRDYIFPTYWNWPLQF